MTNKHSLEGLMKLADEIRDLKVTIADLEEEVRDLEKESDYLREDLEKAESTIAVLRGEESDD